MLKMGIDASTTCSGWCIFEDEKLVTYGKIRPTNKENKLNDTRGKRLHWMSIRLGEIIKKYKPTKIYIERAPFSKMNINTTEILIRLNGAIQYLAMEEGIEVDFIPVTTWRKLLGFPQRVNKEYPDLKYLSVKRVNKIFDTDLQYLGGTKIANDDDIADAILVCFSQIQEEVGFGS